MKPTLNEILEIMSIGHDRIEENTAHLFDVLIAGFERDKAKRAARPQLPYEFCIDEMIRREIERRAKL